MIATFDQLLANIFNEETNNDLVNNYFFPLKSINKTMLLILAISSQHNITSGRVTFEARWRLGLWGTNWHWTLQTHGVHISFSLSKGRHLHKVLSRLGRG